MMDKFLTYILPGGVGFMLSFYNFFASVDNLPERSVYAVAVTALSVVLGKLITMLPKMWETRAAAKLSADQVIAEANAKLIELFQNTIEHLRLRADTAEEIIQLERDAKHEIRSYYSPAINHLQYRGELLHQAGIQFAEYNLTDLDALLKPYNDRIRALTAAKTEIARESATRSSTQRITLPPAA